MFHVIEFLVIHLKLVLLKMVKHEKSEIELPKMSVKSASH